MKEHLAFAGIEIFFFFLLHSCRAKSVFIWWVWLWVLAQRSSGGFWGFLCSHLHGFGLGGHCFARVKKPRSSLSRARWFEWASFRRAPECFPCLGPVLIRPVFLFAFLRFDFWQQQLEKSHGCWSGRGSAWKKIKNKSWNRKYSDASVCRGRWWEDEVKILCVFVCVFQVRRGQLLNSVEDSTAWRFTYTPQTWKPEVCVCACVLVGGDTERERLWCAHATLTFSELWVTCPGLQHTELQQLPNLIHTTLKTRLHFCLWQNLIIHVCRKSSQPCVLVSYWLFGGENERLHFLALLQLKEPLIRRGQRTC